MISLPSLGNGLVPQGTKPLPEPMETKSYATIWCHQRLIGELVSQNLKYESDFVVFHKNPIFVQG